MIQFFRIFKKKKTVALCVLLLGLLVIYAKSFISEKARQHAQPIYREKNTKSSLIEIGNNKGIVLRNNLFVNGSVGVSAPSTADVIMDNNGFINVEKSIDIRESFLAK